MLRVRVYVCQDTGVYRPVVTRHRLDDRENTVCDYEEEGIREG